MATRFTTTSTGYTTTAGLPTSDPYTATCWIYTITGTPTNPVIFWSLDSGTSQYNLFGLQGSGSTTPGALTFDFPGPVGNSYAYGTDVVQSGVWYKTAVVANGNSVRMYLADSTNPLATYTESGNFQFPTGTLKLWLGDSSFGSAYYMDFRMAAFKLWNAALSKAEVEQELCAYVPQRTANLTHWYPMVNAETTDYSGNGRTLTAGTGTSTESGPPIPWTRLRISVMPWAITTEVWYALYDTTTGELLSLGTVLPDTLPSGTATLAILGQPDQGRYVWDTTSRSFVLREGIPTADRVADLVADSSLAAAWAQLSGANSTAMQNRIGQMLGPYRYRYTFQPVDLE